MHLPWKKQKIQFVSTVPGVLDTDPIGRISDYTPSWYTASKEEYLSGLEKTPKERKTFLYRCPGISGIFSQGFAVPMWFDLNITTKGDRKDFQYSIPSSNLDHILVDKPLIDVHDTVAKNLPYPENSLDLVIKINTPWHIIPPAGVKFLMTPAFYQNQNDFEATAGIIDPSITNEIVLQIYWKRLFGSYNIKAGTPMAYIFPLTETSYNYICRPASKHDQVWIEKKRFFQSFSFVYPKNKVQKIFKNHYRL